MHKSVCVEQSDSGWVKAVPESCDVWWLSWGQQGEKWQCRMTKIFHDALYLSETERLRSCRNIRQVLVIPCMSQQSTVLLTWPDNGLMDTLSHGNKQKKPITYMPLTLTYLLKPNGKICYGLMRQTKLWKVCLAKQTRHFITQRPPLVKAWLWQHHAKAILLFSSGWSISQDRQNYW